MRKVIVHDDLNSTVIKSNGRERELLALWQLPAGIAEREFAYVDSDDDLSPRFFQFRGSWYDVNDGFEALTGFEHRDNRFAGWDAIQTQSYFDAILIRYPGKYEGDWDSVVVGYAFW